MTNPFNQVITLVSPANKNLISQNMISTALSTLKDAGATTDQPVLLNKDIACDIAYTGITDEKAESSLRNAGLDMIDMAAQSTTDRKKKILIADMDSTMIEIETLDLLAQELGFGEQVLAITEKSMNGELDFSSSLRIRMALLEGQPSQAAINIVLDRITYTSGGETAVRTMATHGAHCALVSGGFTFTTDIVHKKLGFQSHYANELDIKDGQLTGKVIEPILDRDSKLTTLNKLCDQFAVTLSQCVTVGDGANDIAMLCAAGLGVAYYGKPLTREKSRFHIDHTDLTSLLYYQGYHVSDFVTA